MTSSNRHGPAIAARTPLPCPCGAGTYADCCQPWHNGLAAPSAEQLMRSRYSAYALGLSEYLLLTWQAQHRPAGISADPAVKWLGLEIRHWHEDGNTAVVEFVARYKENGRAQRLHEISRFVREQGRWLYVDGSFDR